MACETCFHSQIPSCADEIIVDAALTPATDYKWVITDKFGNKYTATETTDGTGLLTIDVVADLPEGLLTEHAGDFLLEIFDTNDVIQEFTYDTVDYSCINFSVFNATGDFTANIPSPNVTVT